MSDPQKPEGRMQSTESQRQQAAASRETNRPADSTPAVAGQFAKLPVTFGRYQVEKLLGCGAMGAVYLARDTQLNRRVALKIPKVAASGSKRLLARLETEAKAAAQLDHPSLCKVYDAGAVGEQCFIAMQYIEGETLKTQLEAKSKSVAEAVSLIVQIAEGLSEAHERGIIHRDLKPENIMINRRGTPVIMDFGLAKFSTINSNAIATQAGTILGSPAYMSPEQASGHTKEIDQRSDIYALGTILFELLTGQLPFTGSTMQILGQKSILEPTSPLSLRPDLPPPLAAICLKMIAKNNADRHQTLSEVIDDLKHTDAAVTLPLATPFPEPSPADPTEFSDFAVSIPNRKKGKSAKGVSKSPLAAATLSQRLMAWWNGRTPAIKWTALGGAGALLITLGIILFFPTQHGFVRIDIEDRSLSVRFDKDTITIDNDGQPIRVTPTAKHTLEVLQNGVAIESATQELTIKRGHTRLITLKLVGDDVVLDGKRISNKPTVAVTPEKTGWQGWPADAPPLATAPFDAEQAAKHQAAWAAYLKVPVEYQNSLDMKFRLIPPGEFMMGSTQVEIEEAVKIAQSPNDEYYKVEAPQHKVILTQPIYLGSHEVTQGQYEQMMGMNPSYFASTGAGKEAVAGIDTTSRPVETVSWNNSVEFCAKLSQQEKLKAFDFRTSGSVTPLDGTGYRLPTEAEWEFACRSGTTTRYWNSNQQEDLAQVGWFATNSEKRTHRVGELKANPFGLYDVHGNVFELVHDRWDLTPYGKSGEVPALDPNGSSSNGLFRVARGGSWGQSAVLSRSAFRGRGDSSSAQHEGVGLRVALSVDAVKADLKHGTGPITGENSISSSSLLGKSLDFKGHSGIVWEVCARAGSTQFASAGADGSVRIWDTSTVQSTRTLIQLSGRCRAAAWSANGKMIAVANGTTCRVFNAETSAELHTLKGPTAEIRAVAFNPLGTHVATGSDDRLLTLWNLDTGLVERTFPGHTDLIEVVKFSPDGHSLASGSWDKTARIWNIETGELRQTFTDHLSGVLGLDYHPDGLSLASCGSDGTIRVRDLKAGGEPRVLRTSNLQGRIWAVVFSPTGDYLASCSDSAFIQLWDSATGELIADLPGNPEGSLCLTFDHTGKQLICGSGDRHPPASGNIKVVNLDLKKGTSPIKANTGTVPSNPTEPTRGPSVPDGTIPVVPREQRPPLAPTTTSWQGWPAGGPPPAIAPFDHSQARAFQEAWARYLDIDVEYTNNLGKKFRLIPPGEFIMGSSPEEAEAAILSVSGAPYWKQFIDSESPQHKVILTEPIYLSIYEVTQSEFQQVMGRNPSKYSSTGDAKATAVGVDTANFPVEQTSWYDAAEFCEKLSLSEKLKPFYSRKGSTVSILKGDGYRLPTEAEWEFSCSAGTTTKYWNGDRDEELDQVSWYGANAGGRPHQVGELKANPFGLYDVHGNVWEWVQETWSPQPYLPFQHKAAINPVIPTADGEFRVIRGGNWWDAQAVYFRTSCRVGCQPYLQNANIGFRVALRIDTTDTKTIGPVSGKNRPAPAMSTPK